MMQQNLVSGETKLADYWLLLFKITSVQGLCQKKLRQMVVCLIPDGSRMVPRYLMAPDSSLLGTGLEKACLWLTYIYIFVIPCMTPCTYQYEVALLFG